MSPEDFASGLINWGKLSGSKGGNTRAAKLTAEERRVSVWKAAMAR